MACVVNMCAVLLRSGMFQVPGVRHVLPMSLLDSG
jgi:hypothetical protein